MKLIQRITVGLAVWLSVSYGFSLADDVLPRSGAKNQSWATAPRYSAGIAPNPVQLEHSAIVQVYVAKTYGWRGMFAVHPWIIYKRAGETAYTRYDVVGWRGNDVVQRNYGLPDGLWFGARPMLLVNLQGQGVDAIITQIEAAIRSYPYAHTYRSYPGPNSNTFMAHIGREVPALRLDLPANAIGKDYRSISHPIGMSPTGSGWQVSLLGLLGLSIGIEEGVELNVLGLGFGVDVKQPALRLPFIGRLGMSSTTVSDTPGQEGR
ncbi:DUF3750 domain-containing protein [Acerihabitans sp. TG2]|uniref:DUF3750 domain-containing protein n=1 Tax=Acerihabitans sp. TG2 TaxID=3096008 RepID=UPI002B236241|nr:DUF3750 domain-containing protein [Acerihabitans sp. TG2]MEA9388958.1 DUF3750 domain-containing protein [Acerihabitans sp. TG2]